MKKDNCKYCEKKSCAVEQLNDMQLWQITKKSHSASYLYGDILFEQEAKVDKIIYIKSGIVKEYIKMSDGSEHIYRIVKAPSYLGFVANQNNQQLIYSISALSYIDACLIDTDLFNQLIEENGKFAREIINSLVQNEFYAYYSNIGLKHRNVNGRVADALLFLSSHVYQNTEFELDLTRSELASLVGASRENVTRVLSYLQDINIIKLNKRNFQILDTDRLKGIKENG